MNDGKFIIENLNKIQYTIDNILMMLREKDVFDTSMVKLAIIEANGNLSVLKKPSKTPVSKEDMNIYNKQPEFAYPVIVEGKLYTDVLYLKLNEVWLNGKLKDLGISNKEKVFFAAIDYNNNLHVSLKTDNEKELPIVKH